MVSGHKDKRSYGEKERCSVMRKAVVLKKAILFTILLCMFCPICFAHVFSRVGNEVKLGKYYMHTPKEKADIEWLVLEEKADEMLLISKYPLEAKPYNLRKKDGTRWGTSYIRQWLNNDFLREAFSKDEAKLILTKRVEDGYDKIFILSTDEAMRYFKDNNSRIAYLTPYFSTKELDVGSWDRRCFWWLRTSKDKIIMDCISTDGNIEKCASVNNEIVCVRPAMWVKN